MTPRFWRGLAVVVWGAVVALCGVASNAGATEPAGFLAAGACVTLGAVLNRWWALLVPAAFVVCFFGVGLFVELLSPASRDEYGEELPWEGILLIVFFFVFLGTALVGLGLAGRRLVRRL